MNKYLGLDVGTKTLGLSISLSGIIASPLKTLRFEEYNYQFPINYVKELIKKHKITDVVIGFPKHMNNDLSKTSEISIIYKNELNHIKTHLWDERLSTKTAYKIMNRNKLSVKKKKKQKDTISAVIILQNFLNQTIS